MDYTMHIETGFIGNHKILIQFNVFFSCLILHFSTIPSVRNGIMMMKYVVFHYDEFENPYVLYLFTIFKISTALLI